MIPTPPKPKYTPGARLRITQNVRVGGQRWQTRVEGVIEREGFRPVGGMEMGGKASYCFQPTLRLRRDDGEIIVVALDDDSLVEEVAAGAGTASSAGVRAVVQTNYVFVLALLIAAVGFALAPLVVVWLVAPRKGSAAKFDIYECGVKTYGETWVRFRIQYYIYGLMFVLFDIETVFLYPWAVSYMGLGAYALVEMVVFLAILFAGLAYAWAKGVLRWV